MGYGCGVHGRRRVPLLLSSHTREGRSVHPRPRVSRARLRRSLRLQKLTVLTVRGYGRSGDTKSHGGTIGNIFRAASKHNMTVHLGLMFAPAEHGFPSQHRNGTFASWGDLRVALPNIYTPFSRNNRWQGSTQRLNSPTVMGGCQSWSRLGTTILAEFRELCTTSCPRRLSSRPRRYGQALTLF